MTNPTASPETKKPFTIAIVGGGMGGLALAVGLLKHNVPFHIYESAPAFEEIGAGVAFGPNSIRALGLIHQGALDGYKKHATYNEDEERARTFISFRLGMDLKHANDGGPRKINDLVWHLEDDEEADKWTNTKTRSCIHRARFLDELITFIPPGTASFNKALVSLEQLPGDEGVRMRFADGTEATASAVVGCDGIKSKAREAVCGPQVQPRFTGEYAYRWLAPRSKAIEVLGSDLCKNGTIYLGYGQYCITYPVEHGELFNIVAVIRKPGCVWTDAAWQKPTTKEELLADVEHIHPGVTQLLAENPALCKWAFFDLPHSAKYYKGKMCLLGDSAHASTPHLGAGAGMAMEDAYILSNLVAKAESTHDLERAFYAYDAVRRPRTQQMLNNSSLSGLAKMFMKEDVKDNLEILEKDVLERYEWLWHEDLEAQLAHAAGLMESTVNGSS